MLVKQGGQQSSRFRQIEEIKEAKSAAEEKQQGCKERTRFTLQPLLEKQIYTRNHKDKGINRRDQIGFTYRCAETEKRCAGGLAQERIVQRVTRKNAVLRWECGLFRDARNKAEVHGKIAVRHLTYPKRAVFVPVQNMRMQQNTAQNKNRKQPQH